MKGRSGVKKSVPFTVAIISLTVATGCGASHQSPSTNVSANSQTGNSSRTLSVLYAGSMTKVMEQKIRPDVQREFGLDFQGEGQGSDALAQMIRSNISRPDVFISASPSVNNRLLMGNQNHNIVKWYLTLAQDQIVIAYAPKSRFKDKLNAAAKGEIPWYQVLGEKGFRLGRTDPVLDPKGASTIITFELASDFYHRPNLTAQILGSDENPSQVFPEESLLAQLTAGQLDAIVAYKHEAVEWGVPFISLPERINLGNAKFAGAYAKATFKGNDGNVKKGAPIVFTITIPSTVSNERAAEEFVKYMVSGPGHKILMNDGFKPIKTEVAGNDMDVPHSLQGLIQGFKP